MAIAPGTNDLKIFRRHLTNCEHTEFTFRPTTKQEEKGDTCECPIWCRGYLANERNDKGKPKRVFNSLDVTSWPEAERRVALLYARGGLASARVEPVLIDAGNVTIEQAMTRFLESREKGARKYAEGTIRNDKNFLFNRMLPWCQANGVLFLRDFESQDVCEQFMESWTDVKTKSNVPLGTRTTLTNVGMLRTFIAACITKKWMKTDGTSEIALPKLSAEDKERYGLSLEEYEQLVHGADGELRAIVELMRWSGLRISDAVKFNSSEIIPSNDKRGWNASFIQKKTGTRCITPLADHVKAQLDMLPGRVERGVRYFFPATYEAYGYRINRLSLRAQKHKPFAHDFSPHCLRHTFAIQHIHAGTDIVYISKWMGHANVEVTLRHYQNWIDTTKTLAEAAARTANERMMAQSSQWNSALIKSTATPFGTQ